MTGATPGAGATGPTASADPSGGSSSGGAPGGSGPVAPLASSFIDSVGINIHAGYFDTAYRDSATLQNELVKLGVHYVRDGACVACTQQRQVLTNLAAVGIRTDYIVGYPGDTESLSSLVGMLDGPMNATVASVEGPNEWDSSGDPNWAADLRSYQQQLYQVVRAKPNLGSVPVLGPSMAWPQDYAPIGDLSRSLDEGNVHAYAGGQVPDANLAAHQTGETIVAGSKPLVASETGYDNALGAPGGNRPVSEAAAAAYVPRLFLDFFAAGVTRTYLYELIDEWPDPSHTNQEANFGLLRNDYSEKPAYRTLQALLSALGPTQTGSFARSTLAYQIPQRPYDLRDLLLQTGPNTYALVLWRNASVWDINAYQGIAVAPQPVTLSVVSDVASASARQLDDMHTTDFGAIPPNQPITLSVGAMPVVLQLHAA